VFLKFVHFAWYKGENAHVMDLLLLFAVGLSTSVRTMQVSCTESGMMLVVMCPAVVCITSLFVIETVLPQYFPEIRLFVIFSLVRPDTAFSLVGLLKNIPH